MQKKYKIVRVTWIDATHYQGWRTTEAMNELDHSTNKTVGYLVSRDKKNVRVALSHSEDGDMADLMVIPRINEIKYEVLQEEDPDGA